MWQYVVMGVALTIALALFVTAGIICRGADRIPAFQLLGVRGCGDGRNDRAVWMRDWVGNLRWFVLLYFFALLALLQAVV